VREMSIGENYERNITLIRSDIWRFSRGTMSFISKALLILARHRDILKYSLHPILKKLVLEQGGLNIFRRFRITAMETAEVPQALQHTWSGHARTHVSEVYKKLLKQREWRLGWAERAGMGFSLPERKNPRNAQLAQLIEFRRVG
jgi:hypothetical protein